jgi:hypothetical protein
LVYSLYGLGYSYMAAISAFVRKIVVTVATAQSRQPDRAQKKVITKDVRSTDTT